jgi:hypothetical protein
MISVSSFLAVREPGRLNSTHEAELLFVLARYAELLLTQIIHWNVGRALARLVGINPDLQPLDFVTPQNLMDYPGLNWIPACAGMTGAQR